MPCPFLDGSSESNPLQQRGFSFSLIERTTVEDPKRIRQNQWEGEKTCFYSLYSINQKEHVACRFMTLLSLKY